VRPAARGRNSSLALLELAVVFCSVFSHPFPDKTARLSRKQARFSWSLSPSRFPFSRFDQTPFSRPPPPFRRSVFVTTPAYMTTRYGDLRFSSFLDHGEADPAAPDCSSLPFLFLWPVVALPPEDGIAFRAISIQFSSGKLLDSVPSLFRTVSDL